MPVAFVRANLIVQSVPDAQRLDQMSGEVLLVFVRWGQVVRHLAPVDYVEGRRLRVLVQDDYGLAKAVGVAEFPHHVRVHVGNVGDDHVGRVDCRLDLLRDLTGLGDLVSAIEA